MNKNKLIWRRLKSIDDILKSNEDLINRPTQRGREAAFYSKKTGRLRGTVNTEMFHMFGNGRKYAFYLYGGEYDDREAINPSIMYTHRVDSNRSKDPELLSDWSFHQSWFEKDEYLLLKFDDNEFLI